jgi:hypothetical protein
MEPEGPVPLAFWNLLSQDDRAEYVRLRNGFRHGQKISSKDRRVITFRQELTLVIQFLERTTDNLEARCTVTGVCFAGGVVCVNTRQLKTLLNRCKSSINGSFQQLGYVAVRTKSKARGCVVGVLPSLQKDPVLLKQWTARVVSPEASFCFVSSFSGAGLPEITDADLIEERPPREQQPRVRFAPTAPPHPQPQPPASAELAFRPKILDDDLPSAADFAAPRGAVRAPIASSLSVDSFRDFEPDWGETLGIDRTPPAQESLMKKSKSVSFEIPEDWDIFGDGF